MLSLSERFRSSFFGMAAYQCSGVSVFVCMGGGGKEINRTVLCQCSVCTNERLDFSVRKILAKDRSG